MKFVLDGKPVSQGRPRAVKTHNGIRVYNPDADSKQNDRKKIMQQMRAQSLSTRLDGPIAVNMTFHMGQAAKRVTERLNGSPFPKKPDIDNMVKYYLDVLNDLVFTDDRLIVELWCKKVYSDKTKVEIDVMTRDAKPL